jgi:predicted transcriptional regulator
LGHVARMGEMRNAQKMFVGISEGKKPAGRFMHKWENNIKVDRKKIPCGLNLSGSGFSIYEQSNKSSSFVKNGQFSEQLTISFWRIICCEELVC